VLHLLLMALELVHAPLKRKLGSRLSSEAFDIDFTYQTSSVHHFAITTSPHHHWKTSKLRNFITSPLNHPSNGLSNTHSHWLRKLERFEHTKHRSPPQSTIAINCTPIKTQTTQRQHRFKHHQLPDINSVISPICQPFKDSSKITDIVNRSSTQPSFQPHQPVKIIKTAATSPTLSTDPQLSHLFNLINLSKS